MSAAAQLSPEHRWGSESRRRDLPKSHSDLQAGLIRMERALITPIEAAEMLGISRATLFRLMRRGDFPVIRVESCPRIPVRALHRWIDSQSEELGLSDRTGSR